MDTYKKGILNNKLRELLMVRKPPITTKSALKEAVQNAQTGLLKLARTYSNPPAAATAGLGTLQKTELENRRKTNQQIAEVQNRYGPHTTYRVEE